MPFGLLMIGFGRVKHDRTTHIALPRLEMVDGRMDHRTHAAAPNILEPFFGSGAVFFNKPPSPLETINDIDGDVVNLFRVIRDRPNELARLVYWTPYSRQEYINSYQLGGGSWMTSSERGGFWCGAGWQEALRHRIERGGVITSTLHIRRTSLFQDNGWICQTKYLR